MKVLVVCTANICRSPYGAAALRHHLASDAVRIDSAGVHAENGRPMDPFMATLARERGYADLADHRSRPALARVVSESDIVLCMEVAHRDTLLRHYPVMTGRIRCFAEGPARDVADPTGREEQDYRAAADELDALAADWAGRIRRLR